MILISRQALPHLLYSRMFCKSIDHKIIFGDLGTGVTPDPIPNSEVKPCSADGTIRIVMDGRVGHRRDTF